MAVKIKRDKTAVSVTGAMPMSSQVDLLASVEEGSVIEVSSVFAGLDAKEPVKLEVIEVFSLPKLEGVEADRITLRGTWHGVFLSNFVAILDRTNETVVWSPMEKVA